MSNDTISSSGAHANILMQLRDKSLKAYGIDTDIVALESNHSMALIKNEDTTRALAKSKRQERALAIQEEHTLMVI